jgi:hypothetical protein
MPHFTDSWVSKVSYALMHGLCSTDNEALTPLKYNDWADQSHEIYMEAKSLFINGINISKLEAVQFSEPTSP